MLADRANVLYLAVIISVGQIRQALRTDRGGGNWCLWLLDINRRNDESQCHIGSIGDD